MEQTNRQQIDLMKQMVQQRSWVKTPWRYTTLGGGLSLIQQQALLMVSEHLQQYIREYYDLHLDRAKDTPKSLFSDYLLKNGIPPFRIYLQDLGIQPSNYDAARKAIDEINLQVEHSVVDENGQQTNKRVLTNVFSQFGFEDTGDYYRFTDKNGKAQAVERKQPYIDVKINPDVAMWAFDMSKGYVNHLKMIALYSTKRPTPRIYLLLMRALKKNDQRTDLRIPMTELKQYLGILPYKDKQGRMVTPYPMFSNFKQKVLDAVRDDLMRMAREVPPQTDIVFTYEPVYPGRRKKGDPEAILFHIERTVLGMAYGIVVNHARLPVEPDMFDADPQQQPYRDAFRCVMADVMADVQQEEYRQQFQQITFEHYDDKTHVLLMQVPDRKLFDWIDEPHAKSFFFTHIRRYFPEVHHELKYRIRK